MDRYSVVNGTVQVLKWSLVPAGTISAILVNLEAVEGQGAGVALGSALLVVVAAIALEFTLHAGSVGRILALICIWLVALSLNLMTASENIATHAGGVRDARNQAGETKRKAEARVRQFTDDRTAQIKIAGMDAVAKIDADISSRELSDAKRWKASGECDITKVTKSETAEFCSEVNKLRAKRAAAVERDRLEDKIEQARLAADAPAPSVADPGTDQLLLVLRWDDNESNRKNIVFFRDLKKAFGLEFLASVWPFLVVLGFSFVPKWRPSEFEGLSHVELAEAATPGERGEMETYEALFGMIARKLASEKAPLEAKSVPALSRLLRVEERKFRKWWDKWISDEWVECAYNNPETKRGGFALSFGRKAPPMPARKRA